MILKNTAAFIAAHPEQKELIKGALKAFSTDDFYDREKTCEICHKELTAEEIKNTDFSVAFLHTCNEHRKYQQYFHVRRVQEELGLATDEKTMWQLIDEL